jgi:hypothetical protein
MRRYLFEEFFMVRAFCSLMLLSACGTRAPSGSAPSASPASASLAHAAQLPTLGFGTGGSDEWTNTVNGTLSAGAEFELDYNGQRLQNCRGVEDGYPAWQIAATVLQLPSQQQSSYNLFVNPQLPEGGGIDYSQLVEVNPTVSLAGDTSSIQVWFENTDVDGCSAWDSNYGNNYSFAVSP